MIRSEFLAGLGGIAGATQVAQVAPYTPTLRFAVVCPQSGPDARIGRQLLDGVRGATDEINRTRPSFERLLLYTAYDDHNTPADATVQASFATGSSDVIAVIGHVSSAATLVTEPAYANAQVPLIVPTVTDDRITARGYRNVFRLPIKDSDEGSLVAAYTIATGAKAPHVAVQDGAYGADVAAGFVRRAGALHVDARATQFPLERPDFAKAADAVLARAPDCVVLAGNVEDMGPLLRALREGRVDAALLDVARGLVLGLITLGGHAAGGRKPQTFRASKRFTGNADRSHRAGIEFHSQDHAA